MMQQIELNKIFFCILFLILSLFATSVHAKSIFIGIAGGTGSGKTTLANKISEAFPEASVLIEQDNYYRDLSHLSMEERDKQNFDHPKSIDFDLLCEHLKDLADGKTIQKPTYDFKTHTRTDFTIEVEPAEIVIIDGILLLSIPDLRDLLDLKVYIDTDGDIRLLRRLERDIRERGRTFESVKRQYLTTVKPMHMEFVEPSKYYADIIVPGGNSNSVAMDLIVSKLNMYLLGGV